MVRTAGGRDHRSFSQREAGVVERGVPDDVGVPVGGIRVVKLAVDLDGEGQFIVPEVTATDRLVPPEMGLAPQAPFAGVGEHVLEPIFLSTVGRARARWSSLG